MNILNLFRRRSEPQTRARKFSGMGSLAEPPAWLERLLLGSVDPDVSGEEINESNQLSISAVFACIRAIAEDVAKLPLILYRETDGAGKERLKGHPLFRVLRDAPNPEMSAFDFRSTITGHAIGWGNGYAEIVRMGNGRPAEFWPMLPNLTTVERSKVSGEIVYVYSDPYAGRQRTLPASDVLHIRGLGFDGLVGYSIVRWARRSFGLTSAAEKFGASFFGNSALPKGILEHPAVLGADAAKTLRDSWDAAYGARGGNSNKTAILEEGMKFNAVTIPPEDAQFLETRQFQVPEVCRWFRMPPHKIADLSRATFSNIEHSSIEYVSDTLLPWLVRWEQEIRRKCFMSTESNLFAEHLTAALLRGDMASRYAAYAVGRQWGWLSPDDVREFENLNPIDEDAGGDVYLVPANMINSEAVVDPPDPAVEPGDTGDGTTPPGAPEPKTPPSTRAFRTLVLDATARIRRVEADKISRNAKREDAASWSSEFCKERRAAAVEVFLPIAIGFVGSTPGRPSGVDYSSEARTLAEDLAGSHIARLVGVFAGKWTEVAEGRSVAWIEDLSDEVDAAIDRLSNYVVRRTAENWK